MSSLSTLESRLDALEALVPTESRLVLQAGREALRWHATQTRRYTGTPYFEHCLCVAEMCSRHTLNPAGIAAALLHDVVEDTAVTLQQILDSFGPEVAGLVDALTEKYTAAAYPCRASRQSGQNVLARKGDLHCSGCLG